MVTSGITQCVHDGYNIMIKIIPTVSRAFKSAACSFSPPPHRHPLRLRNRVFTHRRRVFTHVIAPRWMDDRTICYYSLVRSYATDDRNIRHRRRPRHGVTLTYNTHIIIVVDHSAGCMSVCVCAASWSSVYYVRGATRRPSQWTTTTNDE